MKIQQAIDAWEAHVPLFLQESWDASGKQVGRFSQQWTGTIVALDLEEEVVTRALATGANLIFTHHPILFHPMQRMVEDDPRGALLLRTVESGLAVYACHTPLDCVAGGVNDVLADLFSLRDRAVLDPLDREKIIAESTGTSDQVVDTFPLSPDRKEFVGLSGMGRTGRITPLSLQELAQKAAHLLDSKTILFYGAENTRISRIAVVGGAGSEYWQAAKRAGCDCLLTADIKYHMALEAVAAGLCLIDLGHYASEFPVLTRVAQWMKALDATLPVTVVPQRSARLRQAITAQERP